MSCMFFLIHIPRRGIQNKKKNAFLNIIWMVGLMKNGHMKYRYMRTWKYIDMGPKPTYFTQYRNYSKNISICCEIADTAIRRKR